MWTNSAHRRLEIGAGQYPRKGTDWEQFDIHQWDELKGYRLHLGDASNLCRFEDETFTEVFSSNTLEHFPRLETANVLREWFRVVEPGGYLTLELPDILGIYKHFLDGIDSFDHFVERIYGTQDYEGNTHYTGFTRSTFFNFVKDTLDAAQVIDMDTIANGAGFECAILKNDYS